MRKLLTLLLLPTIFLLSQEFNDEFRATWVITWEHISSSDTPEQGMARIRTILDNHVAAHMNAVLFQVRQSGTAYYNSSFEPWGYYAGYEYPGYDPLAYAVQEAHARGLELHAWFNVFQASSTYPGTPAYEHPEWVCRDQDGNAMDAYRALSPGMDAVREYTVNAAMEIVNNYDIDGLHLDYVRWNEYSNGFRDVPDPVEEISRLDGIISEEEINAIETNRTGRYLYDVDHPYSSGIPAGFTSWEEWWRWGVTEFISTLHDSMQAVKPSVRLSAAVLGKYNWSGWQGYGSVFQDGALWFNEGYVDQLTPMHYHWTSSTGFYGMLVGECPNCWSEYIQPGIAANRMYTVGPGSYVLADNGVWNNHASIINTCRSIDWVKGFQFFSYGQWRLYAYWDEASSTFFGKKTKMPETNSAFSLQPDPSSITVTQIDSLNYSISVAPSDTIPGWHILYRSDNSDLEPDTDPIINIHFGNSAFTWIETYSGTQDFNGQYTYFATQANRFWKESLPSNTYLTDSIPSFPPVVVNSFPAQGDTVITNISADLDFSKTMDPSTASAAITVTPEMGFSAIWSADHRSVHIDFFYNLDYGQTYTVTVNSSLTDINGVGLDGNGDGIPGDPYTLTFYSVDEDIVGPMIVESNLNLDQVTESVDIGEVLTFVFDELVNTVSLNSNNVHLTRFGQPVSFSYNKSSLDNRTVYCIRPADGQFTSNAEYGVEFTGSIVDVNGNPMAPVSFAFTTETYAYDEITYIDEFDNINNWQQPNYSGSTVGILSGTSFGTSGAVYVPGTYPTRSAKLTYEWNTSAAEHLIREYLSGGPPRAVEFDTTYTLECYVYGDGSHNLFRFALDDNVPSGATNDHEVSEWVEIDWIGWKLVQWDLGTEPCGSWLGNQILEGTLRTDSFQMTYNTETQISAGAIYFDNYRITKKSFNLATDTDTPQLPTQIVLYPNYPNPFNPRTEIKFDLHHTMKARVVVYDIKGRLVNSLLDQQLEAGRHSVTWNGINSTGRQMASGIYLCRLETPYGIRSIPMMMVK